MHLTLEELALVAERIATEIDLQDKEEFLRYRKAFLSTVLAIATESDTPVTLFEMGANQHNVTYGDRENPTQSGVAHFLAIHCDTINFPYRCFDIGFSEERLRRKVQWARELCNQNDELTPRERLFLEQPDRLIQGVLAATLPDYAAVVQAVEQTVNEGRRPLIFSCYTISAPQRDAGAPFWQLPGIHVHGLSDDWSAEDAMNSIGQRVLQFSWEVTRANETYTPLIVWDY